MTSSQDPPETEVPRWKNCEICLDYEDKNKCFDDSRLELLDDPGPDDTTNIRGLMRCPICHTFYLEFAESDPHHYMYDVAFERISDKKARRKLALIHSERAWELLVDLRIKTVKS